VIANYQSDLPGYATRYGMDLLANPIRHALRAIHNSSHLTLAPTNTVIRQLREWGFERLRLWGRGVDMRRFNPSKRTEEMRRRMLDGRPDDNLILLYVGRIATEKRVELLHDAAKEDGVTLVVVGDGERRDEMENYFGEHAHFMGYLFGDELAEAYASADLFAFTGTNETFGQVVTEAMASGLPVLVPNAGGVVDLVWDGMNGFICQETSEDYREKVVYLRDHPEERDFMGEMSLAYARRMPWTKVMEKLEGYYAEAWEINQEMLNQPQVGFFAQQRVEERQQVRLERQQERQERWQERQRDRQAPEERVKSSDV
jgi:phosphatidylinositol alpha 1,6-mannosyltransferase